MRVHLFRVKVSRKFTYACNNIGGTTLCFNTCTKRIGTAHVHVPIFSARQEAYAHILTKISTKLLRKEKIIMYVKAFCLQPP